MQSRRKNLLIISILACSIVTGFASQVTTVFVTDIARSFGLTATDLGAVMSLTFISMIVVPVFVGRLADTIGKKSVIIAGLAVQFAGNLMIGLSSGIGMYSAGLFVRSAGNVTFWVTSSSAIVDNYPDRAAKYYSYLQSFGSVAGIVAPMILSFMARSLGFSWRALILVFGITGSLPFVGILASDIKKPVKREESVKGNPLKDALRIMSLPLLFSVLTLTFFCAMDNPYMGFMDMFFAVGLESDLGALALTVHSVGYAVSRFLAGYVNEKNEKPVMLLCAGVNIASLIALAFAGTGVLAVILVGIVSFSAGPIYPIIMMRASRDNPENSATAMSLMTVGNGVGGTAGNMLAGIAADNLGIKTAFGLLSGFTFLSGLMYVMVLLSAQRRDRKKDLVA